MPHRPTPFGTHLPPATRPALRRPLLAGALVLTSCIGAACSAGEVKAADLAASVHSLPVLLERATLVPPADWRRLEALPGTEAIELVDLSRGRAVLRVALDESAATRKQSTEGVHVLLPVPFPAAGDSEATRAAPHLEVVAHGRE